MTKRKLFTKCPSCKTTHYINFYKKNQYVCPDCGYHFILKPAERIKFLTEHAKFKERFKLLDNIDPLSFEGYEEKLKKANKNSKNGSAVTVGTTEIGKHKVVLVVLDTQFMMGSMGAVVGEKVTRAIELSLKMKIPLIVVSASGGARMQEGVISLMQMAKTSAALKKLDEAGILFLSLLTHPTTGGVSASFAFLGDVILAEPGALIGFAGQRVIKQTLGKELPEGFQYSEFLLEHGMLDAIVPRKKMKIQIEKILDLHIYHEITSEENADPEEEELEPKHNAMKIVSLARNMERPKAQDFISNIFSDFIEFHGDRRYGDDQSIIGGIANLNDLPVTVIGQQKGKNTKDNVSRNFGMVHPEGYRKSLRLMKQAEKFKRPVINFIDTPGAYPGIGAEERGQAEAIAVNLREMAGLSVPIISVVTGEGGSGGALGMGVADKIYMLENAIFSVISPEGCASILWKDAKKADKAAKNLKLTAFDLKELNLIDRIIPESDEGVHINTEPTMQKLQKYLYVELLKLLQIDQQELVDLRYKKYRNIKFYTEKKKKGLFHL